MYLHSMIKMSGWLRYCLNHLDSIKREQLHKKSKQKILVSASWPLYLKASSKYNAEVL